MKLSEFRSQLEEELAWRTEELRFLHNQCEAIPDTANQDRFRRAIVLLLYSHFEGFCKFALLLYVAAINDECIKCEEAHSAIVAATLHDVLTAFRDGTKKVVEFRNSLPDDSKLHRFARDQEFIERSREIMQEQVHIPDTVVDTESNLKPIVLRKNLYRLGLPYDQFAEYDGRIDKLLNLRNKIAHGESKVGIGAGVYDELQTSTLNILAGIIVRVTEAFADRRYVRQGNPREIKEAVPELTSPSPAV